MRKKALISIGILIVAVMGIFGYSQFKQIQKEAKDTETKSILDQLYKSETGYRKEFNKYSPRLEDTGYRLGLPGYQVYVDRKDVSANDSKLLREDRFPYLNDQTFKILLRVEVNKDLVEFWTVDDQDKVEMVYPEK